MTKKKQEFSINFIIFLICIVHYDGDIILNILNKNKSIKKKHSDLIIT